MAYQELGEARILKRYAQQDFIKPAQGTVSQRITSDQTWQSLEDVTTRFLKNVQKTAARSR